MDFEFSKEELELLEEVRRFIAKEATQELLKETQELVYNYGGPEAKKFFKKFAANGWLTPSWPKEYGGLGMPEMITYIIKNELAYAGLPFHFAGAHLVGPTILRFGNEENKKYLRPLSKAEIDFALGYTEPAAGSDLLSLQMYAEDKGDYFLVNGQKAFSTVAHNADFHWLAVRTDLEKPRHKGISLLIVDLKNSEGIDIRPMITMTGLRTNEVFYDNVKVPKENLVGERNIGFRYIMSAIDFERMFPYGNYKKFFEDLVEFTKQKIVNGKPLSKDPIIRQKIAQIEIELDVVKLLYYHLAHILDNGKIPNYQSSVEKAFFANLAQRMSSLALEITGTAGQVKEGDERAVLNGMAEFFYRWTIVESIYGGTSEIQRDIIARRGLGLPR